MKRKIGQFLSTAMLALCASACCCQKASEKTYEEFPNPALRKAIEEDIDSQIASYVQPYEETAPSFSSEKAKVIFLSEPMLKALAEDKKDFVHVYADAKKSVSMKISRKNGEVSVSFSGLADAEYAKNLGEKFTRFYNLFLNSPFTAFKQVDLREREITELNGQKKMIPVEFFKQGNRKCVRLACAAKYDFSKVDISVTADTSKILCMDFYLDDSHVCCVNADDSVFSRVIEIWEGKTKHLLVLGK